MTLNMIHPWLTFIGIFWITSALCFAGIALTRMREEGDSHALAVGMWTALLLWIAATFGLMALAIWPSVLV